MSEIKPVETLWSQIEGTKEVELTYDNYVKIFLMYEQYLRDNGLPPKKKEKFVGGMPVTLEKNCLTRLLQKTKDGQWDYHFTLKIDGERYLIMVLGDKFVLMDRSLKPHLIFNGQGKTIDISGEPCILDAEVYQEPKTGYYIVFVFDAILDGSTKVYSMDYQGRYQYVVKRCGQFNTLCSQQGFEKIIFIPKPWYGMKDIQSPFARNSMVRWMADDLRKRLIQIIPNIGKRTVPDILADGVIAQPFSTPYITYGPWKVKGNTLFKFKSAEKQTVDLKVGLSKGQHFKKLDGNWMVPLLTKWDKKLTLPSEYTGSSLAVPALLKLPGEWEPIITQDGKKGLVKLKDWGKLTRVIEGDVFELVVNPPPQKPTTLQAQNERAMKIHTKETFSFDRAREGKEPNSLESIMSVFDFVVNPFNLGLELYSLVNTTEQAGGSTKELRKLLREYPSEKLISCIMDNTPVDIFDFKTGASLENVWKMGNDLEEGKQEFIEPLTPAQLLAMIPLEERTIQGERTYIRPSMVTRITKPEKKKSIPYELEFKFFRGNNISSSVKERIVWLLKNSLWGKPSKWENYFVALFLPGTEYRKSGSTIDKEGKTVHYKPPKTMTQIRVISKDPRFPKNSETRVESKTRVKGGFFNFYNERTQWVNKLWDGSSLRRNFQQRNLRVITEVGQKNTQVVGLILIWVGGMQRLLDILRENLGM